MRGGYREQQAGQEGCMIVQRAAVWVERLQDCQRAAAAGWALGKGDAG